MAILRNEANKCCVLKDNNFITCKGRALGGLSGRERFGLKQRRRVESGVGTTV